MNVAKRELKVTTGILISIFSLAIIVFLIISSRVTGRLITVPVIDSGAGAGLVLLAGLITGIHCVGMCGSFIIAYTTRAAEKGTAGYVSHLLFASGKLASYTLMGALFGAAGSMFTITPVTSGITIALAGAYLVLYGTAKTGFFSLLRIPKLRQPEFLSAWISGPSSFYKGPLITGLLSGLLIGCGPLQAMYILAAGNADPVAGARFLFFFGAGTLPALIFFGLITEKLSGTITLKLLKLSGVILIVLGSMMLNKGIQTAFSGNGEVTTMPACNCNKTVTGI